MQKRKQGKGNDASNEVSETPNSDLAARVQALQQKAVKVQSNINTATAVKKKKMVKVCCCGDRSCRVGPFTISLPAE